MPVPAMAEELYQETIRTFNVEIESRTKRLQSLYTYLSGETQRASDRLANGEIANSLGSIQGSGSEADRLAGEIASLKQLKKQTENLWNYLTREKGAAA
ncbi:hypothetical protein K8I61_17395 [bacterium]|nr:hypothetical protein [bacterium]